MLEKKVCPTRQQWLEARAGRIGGSEAASIVGLNPFMTNIRLWEIKTGKVKAEDISENEFVKFGTEAEPHLRDLFRLDHPQFDVMYTENNMWINDQYPWAHASLDGWILEKETGRKGILEIKTTNIMQGGQREKWKDRIPDNYFCQCLHYLMVTGWDFVVLKARIKSVYDGEVSAQIRHYTIERSEVEDDIKFLEEKERDFIRYIEEDKQPPLLLPNI